jgi:hypothetical protein
MFVCAAADDDDDWTDRGSIQVNRSSASARLAVMNCAGLTVVRSVH